MGIKHKTWGSRNNLTFWSLIMEHLLDGLVRTYLLNRFGASDSFLAFAYRSESNWRIAICPSLWDEPQHQHQFQCLLAPLLLLHLGHRHWCHLAFELTCHRICWRWPRSQRRLWSRAIVVRPRVQSCCCWGSSSDTRSPERRGQAERISCLALWTWCWRKGLALSKSIKWATGLGSEGMVWPLFYLSLRFQWKLYEI